MGLDVSHDCWHGAYSAFSRWREKLAQIAGLPPLQLMEGFYEQGSHRDPFFDLSQQYPNLAASYTVSLPIRWECLKPDVLYLLLNHSDCEGEIETEVCAPLATRLEDLLPLLPDADDAGHIGNWRDKTQKFIDGLRDAAAKGEVVSFH